MRQSFRLKRQLSEQSDKDVAERILDFLTKIYPTKTAECVAADTGIPSVTIAKWLERTSAPKTASFVKLFCAYGPGFLACVPKTPPAWLDAAARAHEQAALRAQIADLQAQLEHHQ